MLEELGRAVDEAKVRRKVHGARGINFAGIVKDAENANITANPEFVKACMNVLKEKLEIQLSKSQFLEGCDLLDKAAKLT